MIVRIPGGIGPDRLRPHSALRGVLMAAAFVAARHGLCGLHELADHGMLRQLTGIEAHQVAVEFLKVSLQ